MKKRLLITTLFAIIFSLAFVSALCTPEVSLINQEPYPAIPGEYVKLVFQVDEISNPECKDMTFELLEKYPIIFDPNTEHKITLNTGFYNRDYGSFLIAPYKVRVDNDALDGDNPIEVQYKYADNLGYNSEEFNLYIENSKAEFEIHIDKYSPNTKALTLKILNIEDIDVEALTLEIPKQDNINIVGTNRVVVGDLDSNEYTTADFKASLKDGPINIKVLYTDQTGTRRELTKTITFDSSYFTEESRGGLSIFLYLIIIIIIAIIIWWAFRRRKHRKHALNRRGNARL